MQLNRASSSVFPGKALPDIDYKKPKFNVYMQNDIFTKCIDPDDYLQLKELKEKEVTQDTEMNDAEAQKQQELTADFNNAVDFEEDYYNCLVNKPKTSADFPY